MTASLLISACTSYKQIEPVNAADYDEIRITSTGEQEEIFREPRLQVDTLIGLSGSGDTLRVRLGEIQKVEARKSDAVKTAALVVGISLAVAVVAGAIFVATDPCMAMFCD
jgi:hypothetical protein